MTQTRAYKLFRQTKTKVLHISTSLVLVATSLGGAFPVFMGQKAFADPNHITLTSPVGGENWAEGSTHDITWNNDNSIGAVDIWYQHNSDTYEIADSVPSSQGSHTYSWLIPTTLSPTSHARVEVKDHTSTSLNHQDTSGNFTISAPSISQPVISNVQPASHAQISGNYTVSANVTPAPTYAVNSATYSVTANVDTSSDWLCSNTATISSGVSLAYNAITGAYEASLDASLLPKTATVNCLFGLYTDTLPVTDFTFSFDASQNSPSNSTASTVTSYHVTVAKDTTAPTAPTANPAAGIYATAQNVTLSSTDDSGATPTIYYTTNGSTPSSTNGTEYTGAIPISSSQTIQAIAYDAAGNASSVASFAYTIDATAPTIPTLTGFSENGQPLACGDLTNQAFYGLRILWSASTAPTGIKQYAIQPTYPNGSGEYTYFPSGSAVSAWIGDNFGTHGDGTYSYTIKAQANNGVWSSASSTPCALVYDSTTPVVTVTPGSGTLHGTETFNITVTDANVKPTDTVYVYLYNSAAPQKSYGANVVLTNGHGTFTVNTKLLDDRSATLDVQRLSDLAGNYSGNTDNYFSGYTIDNSAPTVTVLSPSVGDVLGGLSNNYKTTVKLQIDDATGVNLDSKYTWVEFYNGTAVSGSVSDHSSKYALQHVAGDPADVYTAEIDTTDFVAALHNSGTYALAVRVQDTLGNGSSHDYFTGAVHHAAKLLVDNNRPTVSITTPANGSYQQSGSFTITSTANDRETSISHVNIYVATNPWSAGGYLVNNQAATYNPATGTFTYNVSSLPDGSYTVKAFAYDQNGNVQSVGSNITVDSTAPVATIDGTDPSGKTFDGSTNINVHVIDANYLQTDITRVGDSFHQTYKAPGTWFGLFWLKNGQYKMVVSDAAGNSTTYNFTIKRNNPSITFVNPSRFNNASYNQYFQNIGTIQIHATGDNRAIASTVVHIYNADGSYSSAWCGAAVAGDTGSCDASGLADGNYYVKVAATDVNGNATYLTKNFTIDSTTPAVPTNLGWNDANNVAVADNGYTNQYSGTAVWQDSSNDVDHYVYKYWNDIAGDPYNSEANAYTATTTATSLAGVFNRGEGVHHFCVEAVDAAGNTSACSAAFTITYDKTAPAVTITSYGQSGNVIQPNVTATDTSPLSYSWTTDPSVVISNTSALNPTFTVNKDGSYTFQLTVTDAAGNATTVPFTFTYTTPPSNPSTTNGFTPVATTTNGGGTPTTTPLTDNGTGTTTPQVKGDSTVKPQVKGASTVNLKNASDKNGGSSFLGLGWWWLLIIAAILLGLWWLIAARRRADDQE